MESDELDEKVPSDAPGFAAALGYPLRGARFVFIERPGLVRYWLPPILITGAALAGLGYVIWEAGPGWAEALWSEPDGAIARFFHGLLSWVLMLMMFAVGIVAVALVSNVIAAPFNDALSQAVERELGHGDGPPPTLRAIVADLRRTVQLELRKLGLYVLIMAPAALASLMLPGVGPPIYSVLGFVVTVAFLALDYVDWPAARRNVPARRRLGLLTTHTGAMFGFGVAVWVCMWVPLLNLAFMPAAVAGGTMLYLDLQPDDGPSRPPNEESGLQD